MVSSEHIRQFMLGLLDDQQAEEVARYLEEHPSRIVEEETFEDDGFLRRMRGAVGEAHSVPERDVPTTNSIAEGNTKFPDAPDLPPPSHPNERPMSSIPNLHPELAALEQYHFIEEIGSGGMSVVYLAENLHMGRRREALKVLNESLLRMPSARERFEQEIAVASHLEHSNIVVAYSALRLKSLTVFAMQYVQGQDLQKLVKEKGPLRIATACGIIRQVAAGLQYAHEMNTIHRDIKPANLMLTKSGSKDIVKILDFGLAKAQMEMEKPGGLTSTSAGMGTAQYMAPEQVISAAKVDIRADIYSLGCTLYYLLSGRAPFSGSDFEIYRAHQSEEPKPLNLVRGDVPVELMAVLSKMLAKSPEKRFAQPGQIIEALAPFMHLKGAAPVDKPASKERSDSDVPRTLPESTQEAGAKIEPVLAKTQFETRPEIHPVKPLANEHGASSPPRKWIALALGGILLFLAFFAMFPGLRVKTKNGTLVFQQLPEDADVLVDGERVFVTWDNAKQKATIEIPAGSHDVEVRKDGIKVEGTTVTISSGERTQMVVRAESPDEKDSEKNPNTDPPEQEKKTGTLVLQQLPSDADVLVDSNKVNIVWDDTRSLASIEVPAGSHQVEVQKAGMKVERTTLAVSAGERTQMVVRLERIPIPEKQQPPPASPSSPASFTNSLGMKMVYIPPPGEFWMGSPTSELDRGSDELQHKVCITEGYYLGAHEVTRGQFAEFVASGYTENKEWNQPGFAQSDDHPVVNVSHKDAIAFTEWLSKKENRKYMLPSEAEWEYACRGGKGGKAESTAYWFGNDVSRLHDYANIDGTKGKDRFERTSPVGSFAANQLGLYDMHGNVWEWCADRYGEDYYKGSPVENPQGPKWGTYRVHRGGSWNYAPELSRSANRHWFIPSYRFSYFGFRLRSSVK